MKAERVNEIFDKLHLFSIELAEDPTVLGPQYLGKVIAECRKYLNETTRYMLEIRRFKHETSNVLAGRRALFAIRSDELLATDENVMRRPNIRDREALIKVLQKDLVNEINSLENDLRNLDAVEQAVKLRHAELVRTDGQIKTQRSLIRDELDTQSFFGDERSKTPPINESELDDLMNGVPTPPRAVPTPSAQLFSSPEIPSDPEPEPEEPSITDSTPEPPVTASAEPLVIEEPVVEAAPEAPKEPELDLDITLALAEEATTQETQPANAETAEAQPTTTEEVKSDKAVSDEVAIESFLSSGPPAVQKETKEPAKRGGRKSPPKEEAITPLPEAAGEINFDELLASLLSAIGV